MLFLLILLEFMKKVNRDKKTEKELKSKLKPPRIFVAVMLDTN
jgi:hypothetical protein